MTEHAHCRGAWRDTSKGGRTAAWRGSLCASKNQSVRLQQVRSGGGKVEGGGAQYSMDAQQCNESNKWNKAISSVCL